MSGDKISELTQAPVTITHERGLADQIREDCGENVNLCYQCKKCTAGCPVADHFDLKPHQMIRCVQMGRKDTILRSRTLWLCASCETCGTRCPQGISLPRIVDALRIMAAAERVPPAVRAVPSFYLSALRGIKLFGRMYDAGLMAELYLRLFLAREFDQQQFIKNDIPVAINMLRTGKLKVLPPLSKSAKHGQKTTAEGDRQAVAYYPGCSLHSTGIEYDLSTRAAADRIGLDLVEPSGWVCCGTTPAHSTDHVLATVLPMKTLKLVEQGGFSRVTVPCPSCFVRLRSAMHDMASNDELREQVLAKVDYAPSPELMVEHLLTTITEQVGLEAVSQAVVRPLGGMKVVCYYGCVITRPPEITGSTDYEYPMSMDYLMEAVGAECLDWSYKVECCGGSLGLSQLPLALEMSSKVLRNAKEVGAEAIVLACPLCSTNLDVRQRQIAQQYGEDLEIPIFYFTELMALAFGIAPEKLGLDKHAVSVQAFLEAKGLGSDTGSAAAHTRTSDVTRRD